MRTCALSTLFLAAVLAAPLCADPAAFAFPGAAVRVHAPDQVDDLVAQGRKLLALGKATEAEGLFNQAAELDAQSFRTRMWVLRAWMDQGGRSNETLNALDDLSKTNDGPDVDYLYGMAWARRAEEQISQGAVQAINMNFDTAIELLQKALAADPERYQDAFLPLARAAWYQADLDIARSAVEEAVRRHPKSAEAAFLMGRIALSQFAVVQADPAAAAAADSHWNAARDAFRKAIQLAGTPNKRDSMGMRMLGQSHLQLGHTLMWRKLVDEAKPAYAQALAWYPDAVDCQQLFNTLGIEAFGEVLEKAAPAFADRFGADDARDAPMLWWLGYARFTAKKSAEAEQAFLAAVGKAPDYANAWFYIAMARNNLQNFDGATKAFLRGWDADPAAILREMAGNPALNTAKVEYLIPPCVEANRFADAAVLAEICAETAPIESRHWNNLGFFRREEGIRLSQVADPEERARAERTFELSLSAYQRALDLAPDDPTYLNDTAVVLHYYLARDLERAMELYDDAIAKANAKIKAGGLSKEATDLVRTALRDANNNKRALQKILDDRAREAARKAREEEERKAREEAERRKKEGGDGA